MMDRIVELIRAYDQALEQAIGLYLDSEAAMTMYSRHIEAIQQQSCKDFGLTMADMDERQYSYGRGDPNNKLSIHLHGVTQGRLKERNKSGGLNHIVLGQRFIVDIYSFWEDGYRGPIAKAANIKKNELRSDVFGDIRIIRNDIIHHRGIATREIGKCAILSWYREGDTITISHDRFDKLIEEIRKALEIISLKYAQTSLGLADRIAATGHRQI